MKEWYDFLGTKWQDSIDVRDFIVDNFAYYDGDESFLQKPTDRTLRVLDKVNELIKKEAEKGGVLDVDTETVSSILSFTLEENDISHSCYLLPSLSTSLCSSLQPISLLSLSFP